MKNKKIFKDKINLSVDVKKLDKFCTKLIKRSRDTLVTLESFIILFGKSAHSTK